MTGPGAARSAAAWNPEALVLATIKPQSGTYGVVCVVEFETVVEPGNLGSWTLAPGCYVYVGSALGAGGLRGRVARHARTASELDGKQHWHVDALLAPARLDRVWYSYSSLRLEHLWASAMDETSGATIPIPGFGSSDCDCRAHLFRFPRLPSLRMFESSLRLTVAGHPRIQSLTVARAG